MVGRPGAPQLDLFTHGKEKQGLQYSSSSASQLLINIGGELTLGITGFMLLVFNGGVCSAR